MRPYEYLEKCKNCTKHWQDCAECAFKERMNGRTKSPKLIESPMYSKLSRRISE